MLPFVRRHALAFSVVLCLLSGVVSFAQTAQRVQPSQYTAPTMTASATADGVRFAALGSVKQTRLEVYDPSGARVFDSDFLAGNVRDWRPRESGLADGTYQCVLSARDLAGRISVKQAAVLVAGGRAALSLGEAEASGGGRPRHSQMGQARRPSLRTTAARGR